MSRKLKNIIMLILIIILLGTTYFTMNYFKSSTQIMNNMEPPNGMEGGNGPGENNDNLEQEDDINSDEEDDISQQDEADSASKNNSSTQPEPPNTNNSMAKPDNNFNKGLNNNSNVNTIYYLILFIEGLLISIIIVYLIMSKLNKKTFKETINSKDKLMVYILGVLLTSIIIFGLDIYLNNNYFSIKNQPGQMQDNKSSPEATSSTTISNEKKTLSNNTYTSTKEDESVILVKNEGDLTLNSSTVNKKSGDSSNTENSEFYGINAGILVNKNSTATIKNSKIITNANGSNAVFSTGEDSKIYLNNSTIETKANKSSRGLDATYGGYIEADKVTITTKGASCATLATDRGEGTVIAKNSTLETNGSGSPIIYSTGDITISNTTGVANASQMVVIEGKNSATINSSKLNCSAKGNRGDTDQAGVMIYQSASGDASEGTGTFNVTDSSLTILSDSSYYKTAPMFFITNTNAVVNLENTKLSYGSNILISAKGTSEWGKTNSNGGNLTLYAKNQKLIGNIEIDKISTLNLNLEKSSYEGTINSDNTAKSIKITLDKNSKIKLTGNSYITSLEDADTDYSNIDFNGYKLYVDNKAIN